MLETTHSVIAFLDSYRAAFESLDAAEIARHFAYPGHLASGGEEGEVSLIPVTEPEAWTQQIERLIAAYRAVGFGCVRVMDVRTYAIAPNLVHATVQWKLDDTAGAELYTYTSSYTLVRDGKGTPRIAAVAHDEFPRLRALLAKRGLAMPA